MSRVSTEEVLNKAYSLAYFLHQDKGIAIRIVVAATLKLNVAMAVQSKRLSYIPVGRFSRGDLRRTDGIRNKALFSDLHLLQRLVYGESEPYERQKELAPVPDGPGVHVTNDSASEEDLLVYFIKHLVRITTKRNAFYVTLGVSRLLHSYSTLETMEIYNAVIGEPERVKDDYYYRSRKAVLMQEMYQRFGQLIRACRQRRGEERFETQQGSSELRSLVIECLRLFTPWDTQCHVPSDFDPLKAVIASLASRNGADENEVEVSRIHAILHPDCFEKLVAAFGYHAPEERMELPRFFLDQSDDQSPPRPRSAPSSLSAEELAEVNHMLEEQAGRRRRSSPAAMIRIIVDGVERGRLNPLEQSSVSFSAGEDAEIIEVKTTDPDGDLLLATHLLTSFGKSAQDAPVVSSIRLEGGQDLSLSIVRRPIETSDSADLLVTFGYRETAPRRVARLWWQRVMPGRRSEEGPRSLWRGASISARTVLVGSLVVVVFVMGYLGYVRMKSRDTGEPTQISRAQVNETVPRVDQTAPQPPPRTIESAIERSTSKRSANNRSTAAVKAPASPAPAPEEDVADETTRSGNAVANLRLKDVKKIYVDVRGDAAVNELRSKLLEGLAASGVVEAANADDADAALKIVLSQSNAGIEASATLVNARGTVLWRKSNERYSGDVTNVASEIIKDLLTNIKQSHSTRQ